MGDMEKKRSGEDRIWEIWRRREQRRTEYGRYGEEENRGGHNRGGHNMADMGEEENRGGPNIGDMEKKRTGEDIIWKIWRKINRGG
jgi:hypothetical protein